ncbi:2-deoxyglucose-6-phosphate phosphatase 2 [Nakaseomyces bracarensis]|uniref:2-deoxyglucose-6-phosphate phosphatase 2 n=1 Tax=Nakaseomyces bracarensis TaxID=273131 RepID=A0ABR4NRP9_9SACH
MTATKDNQFTVNVCLFDLDGTIVSTTVAAEAAWRKLCAEHNVDPEELFKISHGSRTSEMLAKFFPKIDNTDNKGVIALEKSMAEDYLDTVTLIKNAPELLKQLDVNPETGDKWEDRKWAIVTSGSPVLAFSWFKSILKDVGKPDVFITSFDVSQGKPHPEGYSRARDLLCEKWHYNKSDAKSVVFEDAPVGIQAGKAMGATTIGITSSYDKEVLFEAGADFVVKDLSQVKIIENNKNHVTFEVIDPIRR